MVAFGYSMKGLVMIFGSMVGVIVGLVLVLVAITAPGTNVDASNSEFLTRRRLQGTSSAGTICLDSPDFKDPWFHASCSAWSGSSCDGYWFSDQLKAMCPESCQACTCSTATSADSELGKTHMGGYFGTWRNWAKHYETCAAWMMPSNDAELRKLLQYARSKGYKVRPSGATHSAPGLVTDGTDQQVLVVSLGAYEAVGDWQYKFIEGQPARVMVNAGWTLLDLYKRIRPQGYFLPSQTAGYFFQLAGIVANTVHGGNYQRSFLHSYVTRMRVMTYDGEVKIIDQEADLRYWRNSYGLLGFILGLEFKLDYRPQFQMFTKQRRLPEWSSAEFWKFMKEDAEMDDTGYSGIPVAAPSRGTRAALGGEFFVDLADPSRPSIIVLSNKANENATEPGVASSVPEDVEKSYEQLYDEGIKSNGRGLSYGNSARKEGCPPMSSIMGFTINDVYKALSWLPPIERLMAQITMGTLPALVWSASNSRNDGFFAIKAPDAHIAAYFLKPEKAFDAFDHLRNTTLRHKAVDEFTWNQPAEFRFANIEDSAVLQPVPAGTYFISEVLAFPGTAPSKNSMYKAFKEMEDHWVGVLGARPHIGKMFGFDHVGADVKPFVHSKTCKVYSTEQKDAFEAYRKLQDPLGLFNHGFATDLLKSC